MSEAGRRDEFDRELDRLESDLIRDCLDTPFDHASGPARPSRVPAVRGYTVLAELGKGGMGVVYLALQDKARREVALKMLLPSADMDEGKLDRFRNESRLLAQFEHEGIVEVYEVGEDDGRPFFSMEHCGGGNLANRLKAGPMPPREAAGLVERLARAAHVAHASGVIHRDLKPANILFARADAAPDTDPGVKTIEHRSPRYDRPKIGDFGLARQIDQPGMTRTGDLLGTPLYMAPEQAAGLTSLGAAVDVWALGAILYECLIGVPAFAGAGVVEILARVREEDPRWPDGPAGRVPLDPATICMKCLRKSPQARYPSALDLADDLRRYLDDEPIHARPVGKRERLRKWVRRRPAAAGLIAVSVAALLGLIALGSGLLVQQSIWNEALGEEVERANEQTRDAEAAREKEAQERKRAVEAKAEESRQRVVAIEARRGEERRRRQAEAALYGSQMAGIMREDERGDVGLASELLDATQTDQRGWEWEYLNHLWDRRLLTYSGHLFPKRTMTMAGGVKRVVQSGMVKNAFALFTPDGRLALTGEGVLVRLWDSHTGADVHTWAGFAAALSRDGKRVAVANDERVDVWEVEGLTRIATMEGGPDKIVRVAFSADGRRVATVGLRGSVHHWSVPDGREIAHVPPQPDGIVESIRVTNDLARGLIAARADTDAVKASAISADARAVALLAGGRHLRVFDLASGKETFRKQADELPEGTPQNQAAAGPQFRSPAFTEDGKRLVAFEIRANGRTVIKVWDNTTGVEQRTLHVGNAGELLLSPDGTRLATIRGMPGMSLSNAAVVVWDLRTGTTGLTIPILARDFWSRPLFSFGPNGKTLAVADDRLSVWELEGEKRLLRLRLPSGRASGVAFTPDNRRLACFGADGAIAVLDVGGRPESLAIFPQTGPAIIHGRAYPCQHAHFTPGGGHIRLVDHATNVSDWDVATGEGRPRQRVTPNVPYTYQPSVSPDGKYLFGGTTRSEGKRSLLKVWEVSTGKEVLARPLLPNHSFASRWSADSSRLVIVRINLDNSRILTFEIIDLATPRRSSHRPTGGGTPGDAMALSADGRLLAVGFNTAPAPGFGGMTGVVRLWDLKRRPILAELAIPTTARGEATPFSVVHALEFSPDGKTLAVACQDRTILLYDLADLKAAPRILRGHTQVVCAMTFSPDNKRLVSADESSRIKFWNVEHLLEVFELKGLPVRCLNLMFSPDGKSLLATWEGGRGSVWRAFPIAAPAVLRNPFGEAELTKLIDEGKDTSRTWRLRGEARYRLGKWAEAAGDLARAAELDPQDAGTRSSLVEAASKVGDWDLGVRAIGGLERMNQATPDHLYHRCLFHARMSRFGEAVRDAERVIAAQSDNAEWLASAAPLFLLAGDRTKYAETCRRIQARKVPKDSPRIAYLAARACSVGPADGLDRPAIEKLARQGLAAEPSSGWTLHTLGMAQLRSGKHAEAVATFRRALEVAAGWNAEVVNWQGLALALWRDGKREESAAWARKADLWLKRAAPKLPPVWGLPFPLHPHDWLAALLLQREIEALPRK